MLPLRDVSRRKSDVPAIVLSFLPDVTGCSSRFFLIQFLPHPCESAGRSFILTRVLVVCPPLNFFQTLLSLGVGGGGGGHTYSVLCTVWATIGPRCSVVYEATRYRMTRGVRHRIVWRERVAYIEGGIRV